MATAIETNDHVAYFPGPISLIFGSESPISSNDIAPLFPNHNQSMLSCAVTTRQYIRNLSLLGCKFVNTKEVFRLLGKTMRREKHIKELSVCGTIPKLGNEELRHLAHGLSKNSNLAVLDLTGGDFDAGGLAALKPFFQKNRSLEVLSLGENENIRDGGIRVILSSLMLHKLRVLNLESCGISRFEDTSLLQHVGPSLRVLELSHNEIHDTGVENLAEYIRSDSCQLEYLGLKNATVGDCGLLGLADALTTNRTLHTLNLQNNVNITDIGASCLLKTIYNTENSIGSVVSSNHILKDIDLKGCVKISQGILYNICAMSNQAVQFKVSKYFEKFGCVSALGALDSLLLPNILSFVGKKNTLDVLFHTVKSIPLLYNQVNVESSKKDESIPFRLECKSTTRRLRRYDFFFCLIPKVRLTIRSMDGRSRCKHETCCKRRTNNYLDKASYESIDC